MCFQNGSALWICSKVSLWSPVRGRDVFTFMVSCCDGDGIAFTDAFALLWVHAVGLSVGDAATELMRLLAAAGLVGTTTSQDRQSAALFHAPYIHSKVMLCVANSSDQQFTLFVFLPLRNFCNGLWSLHMMMFDPWRLQLPHCYSIIYTICFLFRSAPFSLSVSECMWEEHYW